MTRRQEYGEHSLFNTKIDGQLTSRHLVNRSVDREYENLGGGIISTAHSRDLEKKKKEEEKKCQEKNLK